MYKFGISTVSILILAGALSSCVKNYNREQREYINSIVRQREAKNISFKNDQELTI